MESQDKTTKQFQPIKFTGQRKVFFTTKKATTFAEISSPTKPTQKTVVQQKPKQKPKRERLADEVPMIFNPKKYRIVNPVIRFEYKKCKIEIKLNDVFHQEGEILAFFITPNYKNNILIKRLTQLCEYDIANYMNDQKLKHNKVFTLTSKNYEKFQGIFLIYVEQPVLKLTIAEGLKCLFMQVEALQIEQISIEADKNVKDFEELANIYIDEIINFLIKAKNVPKKIRIIVETGQYFNAFTKLYSDIMVKVGNLGNICLHRDKLY